MYIRFVLAFLQVSSKLLQALFILQLSNSQLWIRSSCGIIHGCWSVPDGCIFKECTASMRWSVDSGSSMLHLRLEAFRRDLSTDSLYIALGFSDDRRMGEDTVLECVYDGFDRGRAFISYNDGFHNAQLREATSILITNSSFDADIDSFVCHIDVDFKRLIKLSDEDMIKVHDLLSHPHYLQLARGSIDQHTYVKKKHSLSDGSLYPWTTKSMVSLLENANGTYEIIKNAEQSVTGLSRNVTYTMVTAHAILMVWSWWFLMSNAILIARHFKTSWSSIRVAGIALWFQIHRSAALLSFFLQTIASILVIVQSGFQFYLWCTLQCTMEHFTKPTHTWTGLIAYTIAAIQVTVAFFRPLPESSKRFYFNWFHSVLAAGAFVIVSVGIIAAITLGKTALARYYGKWPNLLVGLYLNIFAMALVGLSFVDSYFINKSVAKKTEDNAAYVIVGDSEASSEIRNKYQWAGRIRLLILALHMVVSLFVCSTITIMILINLNRKH